MEVLVWCPSKFVEEHVMVSTQKHAISYVCRRPSCTRRYYVSGFEPQNSATHPKSHLEKCSLCEVGFRVRGRVLGLEAAHIIPASARGTSADIRNGMLLCRNHHVLFDELAWTPDEDLHVLVIDDDDFKKSAKANCI